MKGGSGGSLFPPLLKTLKFDIKEAIAISLFATCFTSLVGAVLFWSKGEFFWIEGLIMLLGSIIGVRLGSSISLKSKSRNLEIALSIIVGIFSLIPLMKIVFS